MTLFTTEQKAYLIAQRLTDLMGEAMPKPIQQETVEELNRVKKVLAGIIQERLEHFEQVERELASGEEAGVAY